MRCMVPQPFAAGGNRSYLDFWAVTDDPQYPGYKTPIVVDYLVVDEMINIKS
jgi:hypothetical protein